MVRFCVLILKPNKDAYHGMMYQAHLVVLCLCAQQVFQDGNALDVIKTCMIV